VEIEPGNVEAAGRLLKARNMLEMISNVERVNDPLWMHKPEPPKSEIQVRAQLPLPWQCLIIACTPFVFLYLLRITRFHAPLPMYRCVSRGGDNMINPQ
jgi:hypothetical protein